MQNNTCCPRCALCPPTAGQRRTGSTSGSRMPQRHSCRPSRWTPPWTLPNRNARLAMPFTSRKSTCTTTPSLPSERGKATLELRRFTVEWTAVNKYTQADGTVRNLTDSYTFTVTPLDKDRKPYRHYGDDLRQGRDGRQKARSRISAGKSRPLPRPITAKRRSLKSRPPLWTRRPARPARPAPGTT